MLRCQNPDCWSLLDVSGTGVPVEFESILKQLFVAPDAGSAQEHSDDGVAVLTDSLRECTKRGDIAGFAATLSEACTPLTGMLLPLCDACLEAAVKERSRALADAASRRDLCLATLAAVQARAVPAPADELCGSDLESLLAELEAEERDAVARVEAAKRRAAGAAAASTHLRGLERKAQRLEAGVWRDTASLRRTLTASRDRMASVILREDRLRWSLGRTRGLSVLSDAFFIWHRGPFVTLNSSRLGRLPGLPVEWPEINAALGQLALAMTVTAQRVGFVFSRYRIVPMGSYARLHPVGEDGGRGMDVFWSPGALLDGNLGLPFFSTNKLNAALKGLMACLAELVAFAEGRDHAFRVPHPIAASGEKVSDLPTAMGRDIVWTRAMKLAATDLKWLIAWAHKQPLPG